VPGSPNRAEARRAPGQAPCRRRRALGADVEIAEREER
jgi:hypothetical protein